MSNRAEVTKWFIGYIDELQPGNQNVKMYQDYFKSLSEEDFAALMDQCAKGEAVLPYYAPHFASKDVTVGNALAVADKLGIEFFHHLTLTDSVSGVTYVTPHKYLVVDLQVRRQSQHVTKGRSVTENSSHTDAMTGQPTGPSQSSRLSLPEIMNLDSMGLHKNIEELLSIRGGNELGFREAKRRLLTEGTYSLQSIGEIGTRATSTETLRAMLFAMHYENNL